MGSLVRSVSRRSVLLSFGAVLASTTSLSRASIIRDHLPWYAYPSSAPDIERPGPWLFFTADEARAMEAIVDRIIPPDPETPGGKEAGCAVFIDRQLKGPFGYAEGHYRKAPFVQGTKEQGPQSQLTPAELYRKGLAALERYCHDNRSGKAFADLSIDQQDDILGQIEAGKISFEGVSAEAFFSALLKQVPEGFFADPIHGGNRDMVGWKMIGFPGIRYNYLDWINRHNERYPHPPVSIAGRSDWTPKKS